MSPEEEAAYASGRADAIDALRASAATERKRGANIEAEILLEWAVALVLADRNGVPADRWPENWQEAVSEARAKGYAQAIRALTEEANRRKAKSGLGECLRRAASWLSENVGAK